MGHLGVAAGFAPWRLRPHIDSTSDQVLKINLSLTEKKGQHCAHDETKHVYFSSFNPSTTELTVPRRVGTGQTGFRAK